MRLLTETEMLSVTGGKTPTPAEVVNEGIRFCTPVPNGEFTIERDNPETSVNVARGVGGSGSRGGGGYKVHVKCGGRVEDAKNKDKEE